MKRIVLGLVILLAFLTGLPAVYLGVTIWRAHGGLPAWDGDVAVAGLDGPVEILRDRNGVAYINANTQRDAIFAQGFIHAQDRFWQMAVTRQTMAGRLAEWMGRPALDSDRYMRHFAGEDMARRLWAQFPEEERPLLEAYAAGVNAWLDSPAYRRPPEMVILHVQPERWRPEDVFLIWRGFYEAISIFGMESIRARIRGISAHPSAEHMLDGSTDITVPIIPADEVIKLVQRSQPIKQGSFSNSWLVSGEHTASGLPLLANDPQLQATLPNVWHLVHLSFGERRLVGASAPGVPGIFVGHNGRVAWGATAALVDVHDIALVQLDPDNPERYRRGPNEPWQDFSIRSESIRVRFGRSVEQPVRQTPEGIVRLWEEMPEAHFRDQPGTQREYRYLGLDFDASPAAQLRIGMAGNVEQALAAAAAFRGPPFNMNVADVEGNVAYLMAGAIPLRPEAHARSIALAPDDSNARTYLPSSENPRMINPASGRIVTANQRIIGDEYLYYLSDFYASPDRALRIHEMLDERDVHEPASFLAMQMDTLSPPARRMVPMLLEAEPASEADAELMQRLADWDYRFDLDSTGALIFLVWGELLSRTILDDEMGPIWAGRRHGFDITERALNGRHPEWCNNINTADRIEPCAELLTETLTEAREMLQSTFGSNPAEWTWDRQAHLEPHLGFAGLPVLDRMFSRRLPRPGGPETAFTVYVQTGHAPDFSRSFFNSSLQMILDLSDLESSLFMISGGQSGHFRSPHYHDLTPAWTRGERFTIPSDRDQIEIATELHLRPQP